MKHKVAILTYNNAALFELGCAVELFALARPEFENWYQAEVISFDDGPHQATSGIEISSKTINSLDDYTTLIIPSWPTHITHLRGRLADEVLKFHQDGKRLLSFCSGAFLLATLGILDHRNATTHWRYANDFKRRFSKTHYMDDVLYVYDANIGCSAGSAAAIDLCLEVIRDDYGYNIANQVARRLVMSAHRKGGQSQFVETPILERSNQFSETLDWVIKNLSKPLCIDDLAKRACMSRRTFDRKFRSTFNLSAKQWLTNQRIEHAKTLLEKDRNSIEQVAEQAGFDNATTMRHHFRKNLGLAPSSYREQFGLRDNAPQTII